MAGKGSRYRKVKWQEFGNNYDKIFGRQDGTPRKEEGSREPIGIKHIESYRPIEWEATYFQEGCVRYAEYSVQYHAPTTDH